MHDSHPFQPQHEDSDRSLKFTTISQSLNKSQGVFIVVRQTTCPICRKVLTAEAVTESRWFPFCSERCSNVDLLRWSRGKYAIVEPLDPEMLAVEYDLTAQDRPAFDEDEA